MTEDRMTAKQIKFCEEYLIDLNGSAAAVRAGYSEHSAKEIASENLTKPNIISYIKRRQAEIAEVAEISPEWVILRFKQISDKSMEADDSSGANKATEMIGKHLGLFTQKVDITSKGEPIKTAIVTLPNGGEIEI